MAPWPISKNGSPLDSVKSVQKCKTNSLLDFDENFRVNVRLRNLFDQLLSSFLKEVSADTYLHNVPALLGDGRPADLFKLYWIVKKRGGYEAVSKKGLWGHVAKECGLSIRIKASIKLIHFKYLMPLDQLFNQVSVVEKLDLLVVELKEFKGTLLNRKRRKKNNITSGSLVIDLDIYRSDVHLLEGENTGNVYNGSERKICDADENLCMQDDDNVIVLLAKSVVEKVVKKKKQKWGTLSFSEMVKLVIHVAKYHLDDVAIGTIPNCPNWKEYGSNELWMQVFSSREALFTIKHIDSASEESHLQKKPRMHTSVYEDNDVLKNNKSSDHRLTKGLSITKSQLCPCCNSICSSSPQPRLASPSKSEPNFTQKELEKPVKNKLEDSDKDEPDRRQVCLGPQFQAEIPEWVGTVSSIDSKWLGTRMWPPQDGQSKPVVGMDPIGKAKQFSCACFLPGSTECIRFHITEKRMKLKIELGPVFYKWRFDRMGEEVSLSWSPQEERRFKEMTINHTSLNKFWPNAFKLFPSRTREKLVSYYFNVLVMRRRSYQNRVTPENIDSDDDETEFGSVGDSFGYEAVKSRRSKLLLCSQNTQCFELE